MNPANLHTSSPHLFNERQRLLTAIATVRQSGSVAPPCCWLVESSETKGARTYTYIKLVTERSNPKTSSKSLGKPGSSAHRAWQTAIQRREMINELEQQLKMLEALIDRQQTALILFKPI